MMEFFELEKLSYNERLSKLDEIRKAIDTERRNTVMNLEKQKTEAEKKKGKRLIMLIFILLFSVSNPIFLVVFMVDFMVELFFITYILLTLILVLMICMIKYDKALKPQLIQRYNNQN